MSLTITLQWILGLLMVMASLGVVMARKPLYSALSFLLTLFLLAVNFLSLSAQFIAVMQILVYAGAILVIFVFVIVLFQDAHEQLAKFQPKSQPFLLYLSGGLFLLTLIFFGLQFIHPGVSIKEVPAGFGTVEALGKALYIDFFFPFEAVILLFLVAGIGALYIAKKEN